jgi:hypothetical protein
MLSLDNDVTSGTNIPLFTADAIDNGPVVDNLNTNVKSLSIPFNVNCVLQPNDTIVVYTWHNDTLPVSYLGINTQTSQISFTQLA